MIEVGLEEDFGVTIFLCDTSAILHQRGEGRRGDHRLPCVRLAESPGGFVLTHGEEVVSLLAFLARRHVRLDLPAPGLIDRLGLSGVQRQFPLRNVAHVRGVSINAW